jgi:uncharacterized protein
MGRFSAVVWWASRVEIKSAVCRLKRESGITDAERQGAFARLERLIRAWDEVLPDDNVRDLAMGVIGVHPLNAADSLQLAAALVWCRERPVGRNFICSDRRLSAAAKSAGFSVVELPAKTF